MASRKQIKANRRNAKKSTGPKTPEGKAASAQNAIQHGLLARRAVLSDEDPAAYERARMTLVQELWPESPLERQLVDRIAAMQWRLARVPIIEAELFERLRRDALGRDEGLGAAWARDAGPYGGGLARLARYESMLERSVARLLAELRRIQAERRREDERDARAAAGQAGEWWQRAADQWPGAPVNPKHRAEPAITSPAREPRSRGEPAAPGEGRPASAGRGEAPAGAPAEMPNKANGRGRVPRDVDVPSR